MKRSNLIFEILRPTVRQILERAQHYEWSLQGFGMLRCYLSPSVRMHVWSEKHAVPNVSTIHDHPWDFESVVVCGSILDTTYHEFKIGPATHHESRILCGVGGGEVGEKRNVTLSIASRRTYAPGTSYYRSAEGLHESKPGPGTVTIISRTARTDPDHARVFYPLGTDWVSAEPRPATPQEVKDIVAEALFVMTQEDANG